MRLLLAVVATLLLSAGWAAGNPSAPEPRSITGEVLEVKEATPYSYLRLKTKDGEIWAAVSLAPIKPGAAVTIENAIVMKNFESKSLKRTFDSIVFGTLAGAGAAPATGDLGRMHQGASQAPEPAHVKVPKAQGPDARTVAEIVGQRTALKDKPVMVRGTVVKFNPGIMGKNWVHLRDGSGSAKDSTHDILLTTKERTQIGNVVVARGIVRTDVDLGSGYSYRVLIEDATLQK